jgi:hypothetical protein
MFLTYSKSLPMFDQHMVQLESDKPDASKVYVEFQEGFVPLAAKYYEALAAAQEEVIFGTFLIDKPTLAEGVKEVLIDKPTLAEGVKEVLIDKPTLAEGVKEELVVDYVDPAPVSVHVAAEPVVVVEEVPVVDYVDPAPVSIHAPAEPVVAPVVLEEVPVVDIVRLDPIPDPAPVVAPAQSLAKKARKTSV